MNKRNEEKAAVLYLSLIHIWLRRGPRQVPPTAAADRRRRAGEGQAHRLGGRAGRRAAGVLRRMDLRRHGPVLQRPGHQRPHQPVRDLPLCPDGGGPVPSGYRLHRRGSCLLYTSCDTIVMGRKAYEDCLSSLPEAAEKRFLVASRTPRAPEGRVVFLSADVVAEVQMCIRDRRWGRQSSVGQPLPKARRWNGFLPGRWRP